MLHRQSGKALFPLIAIILFGLCIYLYLPSSESKQAQRRVSETPVQAYKVIAKSNTNSIEALATGRATQAISITSAQSDYIKAIHFDDGDIVSQGQVLAELQSDEEVYRVKELEIRLQDEQRKLNRLEKLATTQATARSALDEQKASFEATKTQLAAAKIKLKEMTIKAPFSGKLGLKQISLGAFVDKSTVITTLDDISTIKFDFNVPEKYVAQLNLGLQVSVTTPAYPNRVFTGSVTHLGTRIDAATRSLPITASLDNTTGEIRAGMLLYSNLQLSSENILMVPEKSLIPQQDKHYVYVIENGTVRKQQVVIGQRQGGWVAIQSGLNEQDTIITEGVIKVRPGSKVVVKEFMQ